MRINVRTKTPISYILPSKNSPAYLLIFLLELKSGDLDVSSLLFFCYVLSNTGRVWLIFQLDRRFTLFIDEKTSGASSTTRLGGWEESWLLSCFLWSFVDSTSFFQIFSFEQCASSQAQASVTISNQSLCALIRWRYLFDEMTSDTVHCHPRGLNRLTGATSLGQR